MSLSTGTTMRTMQTLATILFSCSDVDSFATVDSWKHRVATECGDIPMGKILSHNLENY